MINRFSVEPLFKTNRTLSNVASGKIKPDQIISNSRLLSVYSERLLKNKEIWISNGRIAAINDNGKGKQIFKNVNIYDAQDGILAPGLIDPHMHIESSMMTGCAYAEPALLNGTTTIFCDSHEIGNVCDVSGIEWMLKDCRKSPLSIFLTVPSTIPATNKYIETAGGNLTYSKIAKIFDKWPEALALGEKMDFVSVCQGDKNSHKIISESLKRNKPISGHIFGRSFVAAYAASGITDTHESEEKNFTSDLLDSGLWIFLRGGNPQTPWHSLPEAIKVITEMNVSNKRICVCTDDRDADDLFNFGLDWVTRQAIRKKISPCSAWSMGSLHPAERYNIDQNYGALGGGRRADIVLLNDKYEVQNTWLGGNLVVKNKKITNILDKQLEYNRYKYPRKAYKTIKVKSVRSLLPKIPQTPVSINLIKTELPGIVTKQEKLFIKQKFNDWSKFIKKYSLTHLTVIERHGKTNNISYGLIKNFNLKSGAVGSSVGHDAHNIIIAGTNEKDMKIVLKEIIKSQGCIIIVDNKKIISKVDLPIAGLLSDKRANIVAKETKYFKKKWKQYKCSIPYMGFNLIPLSVIPEFRLTNKGLIDVNTMKIIPLFEYN